MRPCGKAPCACRCLMACTLLTCHLPLDTPQTCLGFMGGGSQQWRETAEEKWEMERQEAPLLNDVRQAAEVHRQVPSSSLRDPPHLCRLADHLSRAQLCLWHHVCPVQSKLARCNHLGHPRMSTLPRKPPSLVTCLKHTSFATLSHLFACSG